MMYLASRASQQSGYLTSLKKEIGNRNLCIDPAI